MNQKCKYKTGNDDNLYERLAAYANTDYYPFHMPGHKRSNIPFLNPYKIDITEIEGFDNLYHAEDILLKSQKRLGMLYHSRKSFYLVNGSTCGILSAAGALANPGDHVIIARNCHKSVYNAVKLFRFRADYVYPEFMQCGIQGQINPAEIEKLLNKDKNIQLVIITSPTYDGIVSDIPQIAEIVHAHHAFLLVDEAHGAHFSLSRNFPESAVSQGADIVIQSLHKTLPSFTQTAVLHISGEGVNEARVKEMLSIFQTSSPSYVLMAGMEQCVRMLEVSGKELFEEYDKKLSWFYHRCEKLEHLHVLNPKDYKEYHVFDVDRSKIIISTIGTNMDGKKLYECLLNRYHLQLEMYSAQYVLAMTSIMDTQEGFERLLYALMEIDKDLSTFQYKGECTEIFLKRVYKEREKVLEISDAGYYNIEEIFLKESVGKVCAEYIYLFPPGIPMIVPGEKISGELVSVLEECSSIGLNVLGMEDKQCQKIVTVAHALKDKR